MQPKENIAAKTEDPNSVIDSVTAGTAIVGIQSAVRSKRHKLNIANPKQRPVVEKELKNDLNSKKPSTDTLR